MIEPASSGRHPPAASGAVEYLVEQATHLGVPALAGVLAQILWQGSYVLESSKDGVLDC